MGLTWEKVEASAQTDIRGVNVWPYASVMLAESIQVVPSQVILVLSLKSRC